MTFPFDGEHEAAGGGEADFFADFRHAQIGGPQHQCALSEPAHQLIMSDRKIHFLAESLPERPPGNMQFGGKFHHRDMAVPVTSAGLFVQQKIIVICRCQDIGFRIGICPLE